MTFYFRELVQQVIQNAGEHGIPAAGGSHDDLYRFVYEQYPGYVKSLPRGARESRLIAAKNMVSMTSQWRSAFDELKFISKPSRDGDVIFYFQQGTKKERGAVILGATVKRFRRENGDIAEIPRFTELSPATNDDNNMEGNTDAASEGSSAPASEGSSAPARS